MKQLAGCWVMKSSSFPVLGLNSPLDQSESRISDTWPIRVLEIARSLGPILYCVSRRHRSRSDSACAFTSSSREQWAMSLEYLAKSVVFSREQSLHSSIQATLLQCTSSSTFKLKRNHLTVYQVHHSKWNLIDQLVGDQPLTKTYINYYEKKIH